MSAVLQRADSVQGTLSFEITEDLAYLRTAIVNVFFYGLPGDPWVLIDAGVYGSAQAIAAAARERFGDRPPAAIILTHGHFDHVGALATLAERWDVPVFAHRLEMPYITGRSAYPPPDPTVGGGAMAAMSFLYPRSPVNVGNRADVLPADGTVPFMDGWTWLHTPGHAPGHVSLFRDRDKTLIAGDAVITVKQESLLAVAAQRPEIHGPPMYYTPDWRSAHHSVQLLSSLEPEILATGHGLPLRGEGMRAGLRQLARDFASVAVPEDGRYVGHSAVMNETGVVSTPPPFISRNTKMLVGLSAAVMAAMCWLKKRKATG